MRIKLSRSKNSFCLIGDNKSNYEVKIEKASLLVRKVKIASQVLAAHAKALAQATAKYPITTVETKILTIPNQFRSVSFDNISLGTLPKRVVIGMVDGDSYNGSYNKNCFNFKHFNLNKIALSVDGTDTPYSPIETNFGDSLVAKAYYSLFNGVDRAPLNSGNFISKTEYCNGYTFFAFDLTPDKAQGDHFNLIRKGNLRLNLSFAESVTSSVHVIVYMEFDDLLEISAERTVTRLHSF
jgi:hypothetical protein